MIARHNGNGLAPFHAAVEDWIRGEVWIDDLHRIGDGLHARIRRGESIDQLTEWTKINVLDHKLSDNEVQYSLHMNQASRTALILTLVLFAAMSTIASGAGVALVWRMLRKGLESERRALDGEKRVRDFAELGTDWYCEFDKDFRVTYVSTRTPDDGTRSVKGLGWKATLARLGLSGFGSDDNVITRKVAFRAQRVDQKTAGGDVRHWSASGKPVFDGDGQFTGYRLAATNITRLIRVQEDLLQARDQADQANRAKSAFLANMSHELRTPLNAILGFSEMIAQQVKGDIGNPHYVGYANDIHSSGEHLLALINDLLDHSRIEAGQLVLRREPFAIRDALDGVRLFCQSRAETLRVSLAFDTEPDLAPMTGDELRFKQVLINLVTNAIKFAPKGNVTVTTRRDAGGLRITVQDTGIGMDAAGISEALRLFGQVDSGLNRKYEGTGLGLPLSKALVELQGGTLSIESTPGVGTCVTIVLPFVEDAKQVEAA